MKHHLKWLKMKCRSPEVQGLSCRNNIVTACCWIAGRTACWRLPNVCFQRACSAGQALCPRLPGALNRILSKRIWRWYNVVLARPTCFWQSSCEYIYAFICVQYFKHTQLPLAITRRTKICAALVQRPPRTSNECWRTTDARKTIWQKMINFQCVGRASTMCDLALRSEENSKMPTLSAHITPIQRVPNACPANI